MTNTGQIFNNIRKWHLNIIEHFIWGCTPQILFETRLQNRSRFQMDLQDLKYYVAWKLREFLISRMILYWFLGINWRDFSDCGYFRRNRSRYNRFWRGNDPRFSSFCRDGGCSSLQVALQTQTNSWYVTISWRFVGKHPKKMTLVYTNREPQFY